MNLGLRTTVFGVANCDPTSSSLEPERNTVGLDRRHSWVGPERLEHLRQLGVFADEVVRKLDSEALASGKEVSGEQVLLRVEPAENVGRVVVWQEDVVELDENSAV